MLTIRRVVVGVDFDGDGIGPVAQLAIAQARAVAERTGAHVTLLHSYGDDDHGDERAASSSPSVRERSLERAAAALREAGLACDVVVTATPPALAIVQQVLRERADLVVLGKRARKQSDGRRLGSVSLNVVRHAPCLVSVVQPDTHALPRSIVAATDLGVVGDRVVRAAGGFAAISGASLHVIHAITLDLETQMEGREAEHDLVERRRREARVAVEAQAKEGGFAGAVELHAGVTTPTRAVQEACARLHPDLVVMGTISRGGIPGLLVGNTAERLLGTLDCSLLVAKPKDFVCPVTLADEGEPV